MTGSSVEKIPELIAPVGSREMLRAAISNGADAVYFGLTDFNARKRAGNFTPDELAQVVEYIHDRNVKAYVAFNTLIYQDELEKASEYAKVIVESGADAIIVQDTGLARLIHTMFPDMPFHASTQMTITGQEGIEFIRTLGISRVILARELSIEDIRSISSTTEMELEVFIHGALCISYSGQCLASQSFGGRSANRGECAQPCRLPYTLFVDGRERKTDGLYPISPKDLYAYDLIPELIEAGVSGFKIEGRMKSPHYVAAVTRFYRDAIDAALKGIEFMPGSEKKSVLQQTFSRGTSHGYLKGTDHHQLVDGKYPGSRGIYLGKVMTVVSESITVGLSADCTESIMPGDGVVIVSEKQNRMEQGGRIYSVRTGKTHGLNGVYTRIAELTFGREDIDLESIIAGSDVWKTDDPGSKRELESSYAKDIPFRREELTLDAEISSSGHLYLRLTDTTGRSVSVESEDPLPTALKHPLTAVLLREQFSRLGNTPFILGEVHLSGTQGECETLPVMAPKSVLNELRRKVVEELRLKRNRESRHRITKPDALNNMLIRKGKESATDEVRIFVLVRTIEQFRAVITESLGTLKMPVGAIYLDFPDIKFLTTAISEARNCGVPVGIATPRIIKPGEEGILRRFAELIPDVFLVRNFEGSGRFQSDCPGIPLVGDFSLNCSNSITAKLLLYNGFSRITPAYELTESQLNGMSEFVSAEYIEYITYCHIPMFHTNYCIYSSHLKGGADCTLCSRPCLHHTIDLKDRRGVLHKVIVDITGRNTIFHVNQLDNLKNMGQMISAGMRNFRIEFLDEDAVRIRKILRSLSRNINRPMD